MPWKVSTIPDSDIHIIPTYLLNKEAASIPAQLFLYSLYQRLMLFNEKIWGLSYCRYYIANYLSHAVSVEDTILAVSAR